MFLEIWHVVLSHMQIHTAKPCQYKFKPNGYVFGNWLVNGSEDKFVFAQGLRILMFTYPFLP
jgi:hypothetical protein